jgi:hypothetical protein
MDKLSNESDERRRTSPEDARQLPSHRRHPLHSKSLAATKGSRRRAARDSLVAARARSRWATSSSGRSDRGLDEPIKIHGLAAAGVVRPGSPWDNEYLDLGCEHGTGG